MFGSNRPVQNEWTEECLHKNMHKNNTATPKKLHMLAKS